MLADCHAQSALAQLRSAKMERIIASDVAILHKSKYKFDYARKAYSDGQLRLPRRPVRKQWRRKVMLRPRKIVVVGDMSTGKSSLISAYCEDRFYEMYQPTILRSFSTDCVVKMRDLKQKVDLIIIDAPGRRDYHQIRRCVYEKVDLVMICFALDQPDTLHHVKEYWAHEIDECCTDRVPIVLVGTCEDKRDQFYADWCNCSSNPCLQSFGCRCWDTSMEVGMQKHKEIISLEDGNLAAQKIGACLYAECSAKYRIGIRKVFEKATHEAMRRRRRKRKVSRQSGVEGGLCIIL